MKTHLIILIVIAVLVSSCASNEEKSTAAVKMYKVPVKVARVENRELHVPIESQGKLTAGVESQLSFKISGVIQSIRVNEGQEVKKGEVLASLDMMEINAQVKQARAARDKAKRDLDRMKKLYQDQVITLESLQNTETAFEVAKSDLDIATFNQQYAVIKAPANGEVLRLAAEEGEVIRPGAAVFDFANTQHSWIIKAGLVDQEVVNIRTGDEAMIEFDAFPGQSFTGRVSLIPNAPNTMTGTYEVEISLTQIDNRFRTGFYSKVKIIPASGRNLTMIPLTALVEGDGKSGTIYSPDGKKAVPYRVRVEEFMGDELAVVGDLDDIQYVITDGVEDLTPLTEIEILD